MTVLLLLPSLITQFKAKGWTNVDVTFQYFQQQLGGCNLL